MPFLLGLVITHLNALGQQTVNTSVFIELMLKLSDQLRVHVIILSVTYPYNSYKHTDGLCSCWRDRFCILASF